MSTYHERYLERLKGITPVSGRDVVVLGCSFGTECRLMVENGANSVTGFDLDERIGMSFQHPKVRYERRSLTDTQEATGAFDVVYSVAVFEHVHDLEAAMKEAARLCRPGGVVFIISSPLWFSPYGNHYLGTLEGLPWCHLLYGPRELRSRIELALVERSPSASEIDAIVERIHDPLYFNRLPPVAYREAARHLGELEIIDHRFWPAGIRADLKEDFLPACLARGYAQSDLLCGAHFVAARRPPA